MGHERRDATKSPPPSERRSHKRKAEQDDATGFADHAKSSRKHAHVDPTATASDASRTSSKHVDVSHKSSFRSEIRDHVRTLKRCTSASKADRSAARGAAYALSELATQDENIGMIVEEGAILPLVQHLHPPFVEDKDGVVPYEHEVEKYAAFALGLLAVKSVYQKVIADSGALKHLVSLLQREAGEGDERMVNSLIRRAADAISNLARDNRSIQAGLRTEGAVGHLEGLLQSADRNVYRAAADALKMIKTEDHNVQQHERNGPKSVRTSSNDHLQVSSLQDSSKLESARVTEQGNGIGRSTVDTSSSVPSGLKAVNLKTPEAIAKAKLALEKQKQLSEKLKKIPKVSKLASASSTTSSWSTLPAPVTPTGHMQNADKSGASITKTLPTSEVSVTTPLTANMYLPNFPGLAPTMTPLANIEALRKVQEVAARLGMSQTSESFPFLSMMQKPAVEQGVAGQPKDVKRPVLRLDAQGREIDEHGNVVERAKIGNLSTLKVNINKHKKESFQILHPELEEDPVSSRFFDPEMGVDKKKLVRAKKPTFTFYTEGTVAKQAEITRMKSRFGEAQAKEVRMKQAALAKAKAEADINPNLIEVSERFPVKEKPKDPIPDVEWWDAPLLPTGKYEDGELSFKIEKLTIYVEHPVPIEPPAEPAPPPPQPLKLTKKERKKLRTQRRLAKEKDRQEMIKQGLIEPPKPKVKMSNLMKVLGAEATQDPTKLEMEIRHAAAEREQAHADRNEARKLTPAERRKKKEKKLFDDPSTLETIVSVYKVSDLSHTQTRFKVDVNAQENRLTGCIVISDSMTLVVVEGGSKPIKRYGKLMLQRIKWASIIKETDEGDDEDTQEKNRCVLVWQGSVAKPNFDKFTVQQFRTEAAARKYLVDYGVGHYFDLAANFVEE